MDFKTVNHIISAYVKRNDIIFTNLKSQVTPNAVNLHWWDTGQKQQNVGDFISQTVVDYMKRVHGISNDIVGETKHLYAIGSIIDGGYQNATIWGSGLLRGNQSYWWRRVRQLDVRCVRGPETRNALIQNGYECPQVYGDPAILMPLIYNPKNTAKEYKYRVIPHYSLLDKFYDVISPLVSDYRDFIDEIVKSELIISSSLHGVILAEAYGVPAILLDHNMSMFKYYDYYHSTERFELPIASCVEEALNMSIPSVPCFKHLQENLIKSFPVDLWKTTVKNKTGNV